MKNEENRIVDSARTLTPFPTFDVSRYGEFAVDLSLDPAEADKLLGTLWDIACMLFDARDTEIAIPAILAHFVESASTEAPASSEWANDKVQK